MDELPFKVEYARSGRAGCKGCKLNIAQDTLRIARMVQSAFHDGKQPNWFHYECVFKKQRPTSVGDIAGFESIRHADQEKIRNKIAECGETVVIVPKKGGKRAASSDPKVQMSAAAARDYGIEYAKSGRAECRGCQNKILKDEIRVKKVSFDSEVGMKYGGQPLWHHLDCFAKLRTELGWFSDGAQLPGYKDLKKDDQKKVVSAIPAVKANEIEIKKPKLEIKDEVDSSADSTLDKSIIAQNKEYFANRDNAKEHLSKQERKAILLNNKQDIPEGEYLILDALADLLTFGALKRCPTCEGQYVFNKSNYICNGNISEWAKCENIVKEPPRIPCRIPKDIDHSFLKKKFQVKPRILKYTPPSGSKFGVKKEEDLEPKIKREKPPLYMMEFAVIGKTEMSKDDLKSEIQKLGGKLSTKMHSKLAAVISTEKEVERMSSKMQAAMQMGIQVMTEDFLAKVATGGAVEYIKTKSICDWGTDPLLRIPQEEANKSKSKSVYTKSVPKSVTLKLKNGSVVDPDSGLEDSAHVYVVGGTKYFAVLGNTDIQRDKNSYYKIQLLEHDNLRKYYVFRTWGRIGTTIGDKKLETYGSAGEAIEEFNAVYKKQTGNSFGASDFKKVPGKYYPIDTDYGNDDLVKKLSDSDRINSKLEVPVQDLIKLLFDVEAMKKAMVEFDLDMEKMPLGKLSQKQLAEAMKVLKQIADYVKDGATNSQFIAASNQFYTLIPHDFGVERPPIIDKVEMVTAKTEMLESLMEMEFAYGLLKTETDDSVSPIDGHYKQLNTELRALKHDSEEFALLEKYVRNTHAATHANFALEVQEIFKVDRAGEKRRFKPFKKLHNRKLLWHGSRLTNYIGILSHGLKIAPPDAPVTGYMFGKGIYFADMVSKSANYCCTSRQNNTGLMLLSEVALGDMMELNAAKYVTKLPKDKHSCKGLGKTYPNPAETHVRPDGVEIPLGQPITDDNLQSSLLYNEFIVYDVAQVNVQYLFKINFDHKF